LEGCTVSTDAMGCQKTIIDSILSKGGNFVVGLKKNQASLYNAVVDYSKEHGEKPANLIEDAFEDSHGRNVRRQYFALTLPKEAEPFSLPAIKSIIATDLKFSIGLDGMFLLNSL
jgi:hypothetical protein